MLKTLQVAFERIMGSLVSLFPKITSVVVCRPQSQKGEYQVIENVPNYHKPRCLQSSTLEYKLTKCWSIDCLQDSNIFSVNWSDKGPQPSYVLNI